ncbi:MAG TPA: YbaK/EbsC family protein [Mycobacteriales bacterium]|nr:YbaK/EbsC family protein [Mycobacteriales bacterium]
MRTALDVHRELLARDVPHEIVRLPQRITTADDLPFSLGMPVGCVAVRLYRVVRPEAPDLGGQDRAAFVAVLVPAGAVPDVDALLALLDAAGVEPLPPAEVSALTGCPDGLVSPVGLPAGVEVLADAAVGATDVLYAAAGEGRVALGVRTRDLLVAVGARVGTLTPSPLPVPRARYADIVDLDARLLSSTAQWASDGRTA